jgi:hypothetical protein
MQEPLTSFTALSRFLSCHISSSIKIVKNASWIWGDFMLEDKNFKIAPLVPQQLLTTYLPIPIYSTAVKNASLNAFQLRSNCVPFAFRYRNASAKRVPVTLVSKPDIVGNHRDFLCILVSVVVSHFVFTL